MTPISQMEGPAIVVQSHPIISECARYALAIRMDGGTAACGTKAVGRSCTCSAPIISFTSLGHEFLYSNQHVCDMCVQPPGGLGERTADGIFEMSHSGKGLNHISLQ